MGQEIRRLSRHLFPVNAVALTADGLRALYGSSDGTLTVWEVERSEAARRLAGHSDWVDAVALTADGRWAVSGSRDGMLKVWELSSGRSMAVFTADSSIYACAVAPDGRTIVAGDALGRVHFLRLEGIDADEEETH